MDFVNKCTSAHFRDKIKTIRHIETPVKHTFYTIQYVFHNTPISNHI